MEKMNLEIHQGETFYRAVLFQDENGKVIDLSGFSAEMKIKEDFSDAVPAAEAAVTIVPTEGKIYLNIGSEVTAGLDLGRYVYDFMMKDAAGNKTLYFGGFLDILATVTK